MLVHDNALVAVDEACAEVLDYVHHEERVNQQVDFVKLDVEALPAYDERRGFFSVRNRVEVTLIYNLVHTPPKLLT